MRRIALIIGVAVTLVVAAATTQAADDVSLRSGVTVEDNFVRLGDLFSNAGKKSDVKIAYAPSPGKSSVFGAQWLYNVARTNGLPWRPLNLKTRAVVERSGQPIHQDEIEDEIIAALAKYGVDDNVEVDFGSRFIQMHVGTNQLASVGVETISYIPGSGRFNAIVAAPANSPTAERMRVTGRVYKLVSIPVLNKRMRSRDIIRRDDVELLKIRARKVKGEIINDPEDLIGMAARRSIQEGRPIRRGQIQRPILVPRRSVVTVIHHTPFMRLTAQGRALENGGKGDFIQIANMQSKKIIEAEVIGAGRVIVRSLDHLAAK